MKLTPLHDWAVIVPVEAAARTAGGLFIPDSAKEKPEEGMVEAIGPGAYEEEKPGKKKEEAGERKFIQTTVKPGDRVLFERWSGRTHTIGTEERILVRERDILGLIDRPLIPASTRSEAPTAIMPRPGDLFVQKTEPKVVASSLAKKPGTKQAKPAKKAAKKQAAKKKAVKKTVKKAVKKKPAAKTGKSRVAKAGKAKKKK
ncbi:MAG: hypothetical protein A2010_07505 [Nitrospirae bacterium GWD2_57_9]|nr:MAG: hypothetical protein A2010_07505 [Nitrospirae bacterium GWD2_57_9]